MKQIGFTGTRLGMTVEQRVTLENLLRLYPRVAFHHGDCIGADAQAAKQAYKMGHYVEAHPCTVRSQRAFTYADFIHEPYPPLKRNQHIVDACEVLIACPSGDQEILRSGTWATIRYARKIGRPIIRISPNGEKLFENFNKEQEI